MDFCKEYNYLIDENHIFKEIDYDTLIHLLDGFDTGLVMIGGPWCKNCQAVIKEVNEIGKREGLDVIYHYDPKFINVFKEEDDLRNCSTLEIKLKYYALVEKIGFKSTELVTDTLIPKIHVPFFIAIRNGNCVGYYTAELIKDSNGFHKEGELEDRTIEFVLALQSLISKIKIDK